MSPFDPVAGRYDFHRGLPPGVPEAVRETMRKAINPVRPRILEVGAGTGRLGAAFVAAGDDYVAADPSQRMLDRFAAKIARQRGACLGLVRADGCALPFGRSSFDAVLLFSVLSGVAGWRMLLDESQRVLRAGGLLVLGKTVRPDDGVDARMKDRLARILAGLGVDDGRPGAHVDDAREWLIRHGSRETQFTVAEWLAVRSPVDFLSRRRSGARFAALPLAVQDQALRQLAAWALKAFGPPPSTTEEIHSFIIYVYDC